jgi:hypothetical protein
LGDSELNPSDDHQLDVLDDSKHAAGREIASFIRASNEDEQIDLVGLMRLSSR